MRSAYHVSVADPHAAYVRHKDEIDHAIQEVLNSGSYILGGQVDAFEKEFAHYLGAAAAVGVANGTDALLLALKACDVGAGDVVFTVSHTAVATVAAIELAGAVPILVDIDPDTFTMDPDCLQRAVDFCNKNRSVSGAVPKAVVPVHLYGHPADMPKINEIARHYGLYVIEDCAQAAGAAICGRKVGNFGQLSAFSFYPTKNLAAIGDAGAVCTDDTGLAERIRALRQYGWRQGHMSEVPGFNSRLDELQAAVLRVKLKHLDDDNNRRRAIAALYSQRISIADLRLPQSSPGHTHVYHLYVVRTSRRESLREHLKKSGIDTAIHYPLPVHLQPAYRNRCVPDAIGLPNTDGIFREVLSLPIHPHISIDDVDRVCESILEWE